MCDKSITLLANVVAFTVTLASAIMGAATAHAEGIRTIVLFGASWCAPCRVELRQLAALSDAASPDRIEVAWIDRAPTGAIADATVVPPAEAGRRFAQLTGSNQGLPVTAIFD